MACLLPFFAELGARFNAKMMNCDLHLLQSKPG